MQILQAAAVADTARKFYDSLKEDLVSLGMRQSKVHASLFYFMLNGEILGVLITHIDDFLHSGNALFIEKILIPLTERFTAR